MKLNIWQVDAFCRGVFSGNPAAVIITDEPLGETLMQSIAAENNLSETAFVSGCADKLNIRWFTPVTEVDLCGHATLASGHVLFNELNHNASEIKFDSKSGSLRVLKKDELLILDFPSDRIEEVPPPAGLYEALGTAPNRCFRGRSDYMLAYSDEDMILNLMPDFTKLGQVESRGIIVTAPGKECDFVSRFFAPCAGINEDPVTGSAHTTLTPYWSKELNKTELSAVQLSARRGYLKCVYSGDRVEISGRAATYLRGEIEV
ncbi:MAG: PhzF family phenazine biosynthesis protein [Ignavibacteriaceae bacterium]|nr:PhzF family phenazine biosynthesis protein [Ignavibacteriaceae bacterium]